ncbi:MAG: hypothetical protein GYA88_05370 [Clostridiales bacterium]|nr:hypothetical protein [Clostridiales bacterium]
MKYVCTICGYIYDDAKEAVLFPDLPESWVCPLCGAGKSAFTTEQKTEVSETKLSPIQADEDMKKLSAGEFSALCSNLARGCEKQYKEAEAELFHEIADYFAEVTAPVENADVSELLKLLQADLNEGYPALFSAAEANADRGTGRICTWGEKVTKMLNMLLQRWKKEEDALLENSEIWVCTACGFPYIGDTALELCPVCKVPAWKFEKTEGRAKA